MTRVLRAPRLLLLSVFLAAASCAAPPPPTTADVFAPPQAGAGRIVIYRSRDAYDGAEVLTVALNSERVGAVGQGDAIARDLAPGSYTITFAPTSVVWGQFKTIALAPGNVFFVKLQALPEFACSGGKGGGAGCPQRGYTAALVNPDFARYELRGVHIAQR